MDYNTKKTIETYYQFNLSIEDISNKVHIPYYEVLSYLISIYNKEDFLKDLICENIQEEKIIIISDTHIGSNYENFEYLEEIYDYAKNNQITKIIHAGDLLQSTYKGVNNKYRDEFKQINHLITKYPYNSDIENYILFGNHDYNIIRKGNIYYEKINERDDFNLIGTGTSYLNWTSYPIGIYHSTPKYKIEIPNIYTFLSLRGHAHRLSIQGNMIKVPALCDKMHDHDDNPGFLVATIRDNLLSIKPYMFNNGLEEQDTTNLLLKKN